MSAWPARLGSATCAATCLPIASDVGCPWYRAKRQAAKAGIPDGLSSGSGRDNGPSGVGEGDIGIPHDTVAHAVLTPLAYTRGTEFHPAARPQPDAVIHWDNW